MRIPLLPKFKPIFTYVLLVALLSNFGLLNSSTATFVLCLGANNHIAVENVNHHHFVESLHSSLEENHSSAQVSSTDFPCNDIPISSDEGLLDLSKLSIDLGILSAVFLVFIFLALSRQIALLSLFLNLWFTDSKLLSLRSTILLI
jgi:hypothetical protein